MANNLPTFAIEEQGYSLSKEQSQIIVFLSKKRPTALTFKRHIVILKLGVTKAYDWLELKFVLEILQTLKFNKKIIRFVTIIIKNCWFCI